MSKQVQQEDWKERFDKAFGHWYLGKATLYFKNASYFNRIIDFIRKEKQLSYEQGRKEGRKKIVIRKDGTHPKHDKCENCHEIAVQEEKERIRKEAGYFRNNLATEGMNERFAEFLESLNPKE